MIFIHEDNTTCTFAYTSGKNLTMKDFENRFSVCPLLGAPSIIVYTRSHAMSAGMYTKDFLNKTLCRRLRHLTNVDTKEELKDACFNPPSLGPGGEVFEVDWAKGMNTQYAIIIVSGPNSGKAAKKALRVKSKAMAKAKPKFKPKPAAISHAYVAESLRICEGSVNWLMRIDFGATSYLCSNDDSPRPLWDAVQVRRAYNLRNGKLMMKEFIVHGVDHSSNTGTSTGVATLVAGEYQKCLLHTTS